MRKTEIEDYANANPDLTAPTYRQLDAWTRDGLLAAESKGDRHGRYRDWSDDEVQTAFLVAWLVSSGLSVKLAFDLARQEPGGDGARRVRLVKPGMPLTEISVGAR
jgi:DNA-binding transcriptional MerR regulator